MGLFGIGGDGGAGDRLAEAANLFEKLQVPNIDAMKVRLQELVQSGVLSPEEAQTYFQSASEYNDIVLDPTGRNAQISALQGLQESYQQGGLTAIDKSKLAAVNDEMNTSFKGQQDAIMQNAAERGISGSGLEVTNQLLAQQMSSQRASRQATDVAGQAAERALQTMMASGTLGGQITQQDYAQASQKAAAQDAINRFNTANRQDVQNTNVGARNQAKQFNLTNEQSISNQNVANANQNMVRNSDLHQQNYENQMQKAKALAGVKQAQAQSAQQSAARKDAFTGQMIGMAGQIGMAAMTGGASLPATMAMQQAQQQKKKQQESQSDFGYAASGGKVPGRAPVQGDSQRNDQVPAMLSPGEVVLPRTVAKSPKKTEEFMEDVPKANLPHPEDVESVLQALARMRGER